MATTDFDWAAVAPGTKVAACLTAGSVELPVLAARGARPGKTLVVSAGVHGDEFEGVEAIFSLFRDLNPASMRGGLVAVPVANPPAFWAVRRTSPLDGGNLARVFPGDPAGSATSVIAWHFDQRILSLADYYVDLHSGGVKYAMPLLAGYHAGDSRAKGLAEAFGAPVVWRHPSFAPGRTVTAARDRGVPSIYVEARGAGRIHPDDLAIYRRGLRNVMAFAGLLEETMEIMEPSIRLAGDGDIDGGVVAEARGFLEPSVELLQKVEAGQTLGVMRDLWGRETQRLVAPRAGVVVLVHACPVAEAGEPLFLVTGRE